VAINALLADPALRQGYGAAGRRRAAALFALPRMLDQVESVYREVLT
jgi:glycosyltransferase involved in cell wall biosynthesis